MANGPKMSELGQPDGKPISVPEPTYVPRRHQTPTRPKEPVPAQ